MIFNKLPRTRLKNYEEMFEKMKNSDNSPEYYEILNLKKENSKHLKTINDLK